MVLCVLNSANKVLYILRVLIRRSRLITKLRIALFYFVKISLRGIRARWKSLISLMCYWQENRYVININPYLLLFSGKTRTKDKYRVVYTDYQRLELEKEFISSNRYITIKRKAELAEQLKLTVRQVSWTTSWQILIAICSIPACCV